MSDYRSDFKGHCLTCREYDIFCKSDATVRGYRCKHYHRPMAMDESCRGNYSFASERSNLTLEDAIKWITKRGYEPKPDNTYWYVTSAITKIASLNEETRNMQAFKEFKDNYLMHSLKGLAFLHDYDINGLILSQTLLNRYLNPQTKMQTLAIVKEDLLPRLSYFSSLMVQGNVEAAYTAYLDLLNHISDIYGYHIQHFDIEPSLIKPEIVNCGRQRLITNMFK